MEFNPRDSLIRYHIKAFRFKNTIWKQYRSETFSLIDKWLTSVKPEHLILVGPNAGYSLPLRAISKIQHITAIEPDLISSSLLQLRMKKSVRIIRDRNLLRTPSGLKQISDFLIPGKRNALLFCNVLGQLFIYPETVLSKEWIDSLQTLFTNNVCASYHDRVSGPIPLVKPSKFKSQTRLTNEELGKIFWNPKLKIELRDHETETMFTGIGKNVNYFGWHLDVRNYHITEWLES